MAGFSDYMTASMSGMSMTSTADAVSTVVDSMTGLKAWFDDNGVAYTATDLIDGAELVYEMCCEGD